MYDAFVEKICLGQIHGIARSCVTITWERHVCERAGGWMDLLGSHSVLCGHQTHIIGKPGIILIFRTNLILCIYVTIAIIYAAQLLITRLC